MSAATPLLYADRAERYLRQRGIPYDEHQISIDLLTPRQRRRALHKERHQFGHAPDVVRAVRQRARRAEQRAARSRERVAAGWGPYDDDLDGYRPDIDPLGMYDGPNVYDDVTDAHDLGYCVTPGCNCCGGEL